MWTRVNLSAPGIGRPLGRLLGLGLGLAALGILALLSLRAAVSVDTSHDTWWYHLPFAARLSGLLSSDDFVFSDRLEARFAGFSLLFDWVQGLFWRLTGRAEAANFVALGTFVLYLAFLARRFRVPPHLALIALIAVPLIQIHVTAAHVDLPANLALTVAILILLPLWRRDEPVRRSDVALFVLGCGLAANGKLQLVPVAGLVFALGCIAVLRAWRGQGSGDRLGASKAPLLFLLLLASIPLVFFTPLKNTLMHGNPLFPMALQIGPLTLSGVEGRGVSQTALEHGLARYRQRLAAGKAPPPGGERPDRRPKTAPGPSLPPDTGLPVSVDPLLWVRSVLEIGMEPVLGRGQWVLLGTQHPPLPPRYGGYFGWYVVFHLVLFAALVSTDIRARALPLALFLGASLTVSLLPAQAFLRYYLFWMILLVSLNLILLSQDRLKATLSRLQLLIGLVGLASFLMVVYATRGEFIQPRFYQVEDLLEARRDPAILAAVEAQGASCLAGERAPRFFIYSRLFSPGSDHRLKMGPIAGQRLDEVAGICGPEWPAVIVRRDDAGLIGDPYLPREP